MTKRHLFWDGPCFQERQTETSRGYGCCTMTPTVLNRRASRLRNSNKNKGGLLRPPGPGRLSAAGCSGAFSTALTGLGKSPCSQPATAAHAGAGLERPADTDVTDHTGVSLRLCSSVPPASLKGQGVRAALRATPSYWTDLTGGPIPYTCIKTIKATARVGLPWSMSFREQDRFQGCRPMFSERSRRSKSHKPKILPDNQHRRMT